MLGLAADGFDGSALSRAPEQMYKHQAARRQRWKQSSSKGQTVVGEVGGGAMDRRSLSERRWSPAGARRKRAASGAGVKPTTTTTQRKHHRETRLSTASMLFVVDAVRRPRRNNNRNVITLFYFNIPAVVEVSVAGVVHQTHQHHN